MCGQRLDKLLFLSVYHLGHNPVIFLRFTVDNFYIQGIGLIFIAMNNSSRFNRNYDLQLASELRLAELVSGRFVCLHAALGDALLKSSKDFIN